MTREPLACCLLVAMVSGMALPKASAEEPDGDTRTGEVLQPIERAEVVLPLEPLNELEEPEPQTVRPGPKKNLPKPRTVRPEPKKNLPKSRTVRPQPKKKNPVDGLIQVYLMPYQEQPLPSERFDSAVVERGRAAFEQRCTQCHDSARALEKEKDLAGWRRTAQRMARKSQANIPVSDIEPIATYLASLSAPPPAEAPETAPTEAPRPTLLGDQLDLYATISTVWRGSAEENSDLENVVENRGFFPEVWLGAEWHPDSPISARIVACTTCHRPPAPGDRFELVEGAVRLDLSQFLGCQEDGPQVTIDAGRFVVPFGAFAAQSHPGAFRTVTKPLIFNMGQLVRRTDIGPAVLPMPYSDEGALVNLSLPLYCDVTATMDAYVVNGLQGSTPGVDFLSSRRYVDNNSEPAVGGRVTVGDQFVRFGGSIMAGRFNADGLSGLSGQVLNYEIFGVDVTARYQDVVRVQAEYALRNSDELISVPGFPREDVEVDGYSVEGELRLCEEPRISLVVRYDTLGRNSLQLPPMSQLSDGKFNLHRITWGFNVALPGGSLLLINHEHWSMPEDLDSVDVVGLRWLATF